MLCGPRGPPLASVGNVSPVEGIVQMLPTSFLRQLFAITLPLLFVTSVNRTIQGYKLKF